MDFQICLVHLFSLSLIFYFQRFVKPNSDVCSTVDARHGKPVVLVFIDGELSINDGSTLVSITTQHGTKTPVLTVETTNNVFSGRYDPDTLMSRMPDGLML